MDKLTGTRNIKVISDAYGRASNRRMPIIETFRLVAEEFGGAFPGSLVVCETMEKLHAAVSIVDDLLDGEELRNDTPVFHVRHSKSLAALASIHLLLEAIRDCVFAGVEIEWLMGTLLEMTEAEEADIGLIPKPEHTSFLDWYEQTSGSKTAIELSILLAICIGKPTQRLEGIPTLKEAVRQLGVLLQMTNDWRDLFANDPMYRMGGLSYYTLTFSMPLAVYCEMSGNDLTAMLGTQMPIEAARELLKKILSVDVQDQCRQLIMDKRNKLADAISMSGIRSLAALDEIAAVATNGHFWRRA